MDLGLKGKKAIISGGSKGIGLAIANKLLDEGASVGFFARDRAGVEAASKELSAKGKVTSDALDAGDFEAVKSWVARAAAELGGIDIVVNNASASAQMDWEKDSWQKSFDTDVLSAVAMVDAAKPYLKKSEAPAILQIATITAVEHHDMPISPSYGMVKAAVINFSAQLAQRLGAEGIRSNVVSPGPIYIEGGAWHGIKENAFELYERDRLQHPMERLGSAEEVANVAVFLCSPAASWVNGANVVVDGGFTKMVGY